MTDSSQKFIARNRAPRVQIEYDVELYGSEKKVQLPFVMGVMSDLAGKSTVAQPSVENRKFLEIEVDNFDDRMRAMQPRAAFSVANTLTGEGNLEVDLTFEKMADFSPTAIAEKIAPLRSLLEARSQLSNLMTYMDGKVGAETLIEKILANPSLLTALAEPDGADAQSAAALDSLREMASDAPQKESGSDGILDALKSNAPLPETVQDNTDDVLSTLASSPVPDPEPSDSGADVLAGMRNRVPVQEPEIDDGQNALDSLRDAPSAENPPDTHLEDTLAGLASAAPTKESAADTTASALETLQQADVPAETGDNRDALLADLAAAAPDDRPETDAVDAALDSLADVKIEARPADTIEDTLGGLAMTVPEETPEADDVGAALDSLADVEIEAPSDDSADDALADLAATAPEDKPEVDDVGSALDSLADVEIEGPVEDGVDDALAGLAAAAPVAVPEADDMGAALDSLAEFEIEAPSVDHADDALAGLAAAAPEAVSESDDVGAALDSLADVETETPAEDGADDALADLAAAAPEAALESDDVGAALDSLADVEVEGVAEDSVDDALAGLAAATPDEMPDVDDVGSALDSLGETEIKDSALDATGDDIDDLADLLGDAEEPQVDDDAGLDELLSAAEPEDDLISDTQSDDLDDLLTSGEDPEPMQDIENNNDLDDLLSGDDTSGNVEQVAPADDLDDLLGDLDALDDDGKEAQVVEIAGEDESAILSDPADDLDDLLADDDPLQVTSGDTASDNDLDDLLGDSEPEAEVEPAAAADDLDDLLGDLSEPEPPDNAVQDVDLDDLLDETPTAQSDGGGQSAGEPEFAFGVLSAERPDPTKLNRKRFRIALMGDFSGRAARGQLETGDALATRAPILLDPDTVEDVIESFATDLVLPIGKDGAGVEVKLGGLDDLHPDELYEKVPILYDLQSLRSQLANGATSANAAAQLKAWGEAYGTPVAAPKTRSGGNAVPANLKLSDFQKLIGDTGASLTQASPIEDMIAQIVGPHVRAVADADTVAMQQAVDDALSSAMRLILHHPEIQSVEAQWRSLDLIARSIETDDTLEVMLYDISAEEIAADLATAEDLTQSGLVRLLTEEPLDPETGRGGYSAMIGLYTFEETPPHAELLGRVARVAAHVDAPFLAALSPAFMETPKEDRHPLVATGWDTLRGMPEAGYLGLASPRFLLRRPYGAKSEPIYEFAFEEFTMSAGLSGMLWANPVVLVAILLAKSFRENGAHLGLGKIMSLGDMPYHFVTDQYGDQVALPCTERNLTLEKVEKVMARGVMPVVSIKGRDEIRLASFQSLAGGDILGPWSDVPPPPPSPPDPTPIVAPEPVAETAGVTEDAAEDDLGLDDLLAGFDDDAVAGTDAGDVDDDLASLLEDL